MSYTEATDYQWLAHLNPRRLQLLLDAAVLGSPFTAKQLEFTHQLPPASLTRDLNALERAGLVIADPPMTTPRQGQRVTYALSPAAPAMFEQLSALVSDAWATPLPSS